MKAARRRTLVLAGAIVVAVVVAGVLGTRLLSTPPRLVAWQMSAPDAHRSSGKVTVETTEFPVLVPAFQCVSRSDPWLAPPTVTYTPTAVTITLQLSDGQEDVRMCGATLDTGIWVPVHLSEPLAGRAVFDGSHEPPIERWHPQG